MDPFAPIMTRPLDAKIALDGAIAEAVARLRNEPAVADDCFTAMREALQAAPDAATCLELLKKLVATALSSWTPGTAEPETFAAVARDAGFAIATYPVGKTQGPVVVREATYPTQLGADRPLLRSLCRQFCTEVLEPAWRTLRSFECDDVARAFAAILPELVRVGSLEAPTTPRVPPAPRFWLRVEPLEAAG